MIRRLFALIAVLALVLSACASTGGETAAGGPSEGIEVHGHWTIEVLDPDGTLASHTEFENELLSASGIFQVLARTRTMGYWRVSLSGACLSSPCWISQEAWDSSVQSDNLTASFISSEALLRLSGSVVAERDGAISDVGSGFSTCNVSNTPVSCVVVAPWHPTTNRTLDPADQVSVATGQTVQVMVDISFS